MKLVVGLFILLLVIIVGGKFAMDYAGGNATIPFFGKTAKATVKGQTFKLYTAKTEKEKQDGLSTRKSLAKDYGMLFEFDSPGFYTFWMKDMKFPIDILFIKDDKVVTVFGNVQPPQNGQLPLYTPEEPANKVLEINAGLSNTYGIKKGDTVIIQK